MRLKDHFAYLQSHQSHQKTSLKRHRTESPVQSVPASYQSQVDSSSVIFAESSPFDDLDPFFLAPIEEMYPSREELMSWMRMHGNPERQASFALTALALSDVAGSGAVTKPPITISSSRPRVSFAPEIVTSVKEIPSHRSLTKEDKDFLYRDKSTKSTEMKKSYLERKFERSRHCPENALEETVFFRSHLGELVHPAHWVSFVRCVLPSLSRDTAVPGYSSFDEYFGVLEQYARFYDTAMREKIFQPQP